MCSTQVTAQLGVTLADAVIQAVSFDLQRNRHHRPPDILTLKTNRFKKQD